MNENSNQSESNLEELFSPVFVGKEKELGGVDLRATHD